MKRLFYFSVAMLLAIILGWVGSRLLFVSHTAFSDTQLFIFGLLIVFGGIFFVGFADPRVGILIMLIGLYVLARAADIFEHAWLAKAFGVACLFGVMLLLYLGWPGNQHKWMTRKSASSPPLPPQEFDPNKKSPY